MSCDAAIVVNHLSKIYQIYNAPQDRLKQSLWGGKKKYYREFWALRDVSVTIPKGKTIGIIGRNGSGKSTLLQSIVGTLQPTTGDVQVNGRVSALLELGSGFNPEFTGRENAYINGVIMGLSHGEMTQRMAAIEQFAEIGDFIDQPVKLYSSGMYLRLAFACAINVDPDILIIDEALSVGDMQFQLKCIDKMKSFKTAGKTILFVSHDFYSVRNFCDEAIWMMDGKIHLQGNVKTVVEQYENSMQVVSENKETSMPLEKAVERVLTIDKIVCRDTEGKQQDTFKFGQAPVIVVDYTLHSPREGIVGGMALYDKQNTYVCGLNTKLDEQLLPTQPGQYQLILSYQDLNLLPGVYYIDVGFFESSAVVHLDYKSRETFFRIDSGEYVAEGIVYLKHHWQSKNK